MLNGRFLLSILFFSCLLFTGNSSVYAVLKDTLSAQVYDPYTYEALPENAPEWLKQVAEDPDGVNYHKIQHLFNEWKANDVDVRVRTVDNKQVVNFIRRWSSAYKRYVAADGRIELPSMDEYRKKVDAMNRRAADVQAPVWRNIGPNRTYEQKDGEVKRKDSQVCVFRIAVALSDSATLYCGTESGVVFKTTDSGKNWKPCAPQHVFGGSIYSIAIDPVDKNIVYVGGGPWLWKSVDGGDSWVRCGGITSRVNSIRINPDNRQYITASAGSKHEDLSGSGFYVSLNGGESFVRTLSGICFDHELQPGNPDRIYLVRRESGPAPDATPKKLSLFGHFLDCEAHLDMLLYHNKTANHTNEK